MLVRLLINFAAVQGGFLFKKRAAELFEYRSARVKKRQLLLPLKK